MVLPTLYLPRNFIPLLEMNTTRKQERNFEQQENYRREQKETEILKLIKSFTTHHDYNENISSKFHTLDTLLKTTPLFFEMTSTHDLYNLSKQLWDCQSLEKNTQKRQACKSLYDGYFSQYYTGTNINRPRPKHERGAPNLLPGLKGNVNVLMKEMAQGKRYRKSPKFRKFRKFRKTRKNRN